jgi:hypothetical protein
MVVETVGDACATVLPTLEANVSLTLSTRTQDRMPAPEPWNGLDAGVVTAGGR